MELESQDKYPEEEQYRERRRVSHLVQPYPLQRNKSKNNKDSRAQFEKGLGEPLHSTAGELGLGRAGEEESKGIPVSVWTVMFLLGSLHRTLSI